MRQFLLLLFVLFVINKETKAQILFDKDWREGCYYDLQGNKISGLIYSEPASPSLLKGRGDHILYKKEKGADRKKILSDSIRSYVIGVDSFVVSHFDDLAKKPFLQVIIDGPLKLYFSTIARPNTPVPTGGMYSSSTTIKTPNGPVNIPSSNYRPGPVNPFSSSYTVTSYYYGTGPDEVTELDRKSFIDVMSRMMADKPQVVELIKNKTFRYGDMDNLIEYYRRPTK